ncbi:MAG: ATP-grasp domain-containing protein [Actinomycetota bacterium]|nr:ATP-grasp domain-containing protein [Actinomycetota bacterium]
MRALVVDDGRSLGALAAVRSLARAGWEVGVASPGPVGFAATSSYMSRHLVAPFVHLDPDAFLAAIQNAISSGGYELVFAGGDAELMALSHGRHRLDALLPYAEHSVVETALDKLHVHHLAQASGLSTPTTAPADAVAQWESWPVVVKARRHWSVGRRAGSGRLDPSVCAAPDEARQRIAQITDNGAEAILQERVPGLLMAYTALCDRGGRVVAAVQQEVDGLDPSPPGSSTRARTVPLDPALAGGVQELLNRLGWFGIAELQFMKRSGEAPKMIDLNGRFYGSMSLAISAGIDLPALWASLAVGRDVPSAVARTGVRYQWLHGDLLRALRERRSGLTADVGKTLAYGCGAVHPLWSKSDPRPCLRYLLRAPQRSASLLRRK